MAKLKVMIITQKNKVFEYYVNSAYIALDKYIEDVLGFEKDFTINKDTWQALSEKVDDMSIRVPLINGLCKKSKDTISRVITSYVYTFVANSEVNGVYYKVLEGGEGAAVVGYRGISRTVHILPEFNNVRVTEIADRAFDDLDGVDFIDIPTSINHIGTSAFHTRSNVTIRYAGSSADWNKISNLAEADLEGCNILYNCQIKGKI